MSTNLSIRVLPEPVRSIAFGSIGAAYAGIGSPITNPARWFMLQNFTDAAMMISMDGVNDHFPINATSYVIMDVASNKSVNGGVFMIAAGTRFYVKQLSGAAGVGSVYLSVFYGFAS